MTAIAAVLGTRGDESVVVHRCLGAMWHRGDVDAGSGWLPGAAVGVASFDWEVQAGIAPPIGICQEDGLLVAADASLYYVDDLVRRLGIQRTADLGAPRLLLAAYRKWGEAFIDHVEGDYACVIVDQGRGVLLGARDHVGRRPLHYAVAAGRVVVASQARAVAAETRAGLNEIAVVAALGGLLGGSRETGFLGVFPVPAGGLVVAGRGGVRLRLWSAPEFRIGGRPRFREAGEELRLLLAEAIAQRVVAPKTAVWLSGGADSTAVFGAGQVRPEIGGVLAPVSISYPVGDSAREDDYIRATAAHWGREPTWIQSEEVELFDHLEQRMAVRDDPYAHTFEAMNLRLASTSRGIGANCAFDGYGGDQLFHVSTSYLADLLVRPGRWRELRQALRHTSSTSLRQVVSRCVFPWLPAAARDHLDVLRGRDLSRGTAARQAIPGWLVGRWLADPALGRRARKEPEKRWLESPSAYESRWYVEAPYFPRAAAWAAGLALSEGIAVRSPLLDRRILDFAASRPLAERVGPVDSKLVLKEALRGLIPDSVLAPRPSKTGVPRGYFTRKMQESFPAWFNAAFAERSLLADYGFVDLAALRQAVKVNVSGGPHVTRVQLFLTLQAELWMRSLKGP